GEDHVICVDHRAVGECALPVQGEGELGGVLVLFVGGQVRDRGGFVTRFEGEQAVVHRLDHHVPGLVVGAPGVTGLDDATGVDHQGVTDIACSLGTVTVAAAAAGEDQGRGGD